MWIALYLGLIVVSTAITWHGAVRLERATELLAAHYHLPAVIRGALLAAIGSSFPEFASAVLATALHDDFDLGVAVIVGSAMFNILVIPGLAGILSGGLDVRRQFLYRDALFYVSAVLALLLVFSLAVVYHPSEAAPHGGTMHRWITVLPVGLYAFFLFAHHQDEVKRRQEALAEGSLVVDPEEERGPAGRHWLLLVYSLTLILIGVEGLVRSAIELGQLSGTPTFLWGVTVIAVATSLPDLFISVRASRQGNDTVSLANVLGSNIFDLLIAIPAGVLVAGEVYVNFGVAAPLMTCLGLATIVFAVLLRTKLILSTGESWALLILYVLFVVLMIFESAGLTDFVITGETYG